jgi:prevent-host-death family protein
MSTISIADAGRKLSQVINQAAYGREAVVITSRGQAKAVLLGMDAFTALVGARNSEMTDLPLDEFRRQFSQALAEAGYTSPEQMVELVRQVRREMADEREAA